MNTDKPPAEAKPCGCGEATCTVPWEPGCGLGKSEQHAEAQAQGGREVVDYQRALELVGDAYNAGTHGIGYSQQAADLFEARTAPPSAPVGVEKMRAEDAPALPGSWMLADAYAAGWNDALAQQPAADPLEEWANRPLNFTATVGVFKDGVQPAAEPTNEAVAEFRRFLNGKQPVDGKITMKQARHILREWPGQHPATVDEAVERVRRGPARLWQADLVGGQISIDRMHEILNAALCDHDKEGKNG